MPVTLRAAVAEIERRGILLVFPLHNRPEPGSLWSAFFPRSRMRWEWDAGGDDRVPQVWHLREELSRSGRVAYAKWFQGRATFFSLPLFAALLHVFAADDDVGLSSDALRLYRTLEENSPLSTKELKREAGLQGRANERLFERAMKELWSRLLVVGYGEKDDGAFPSLQVGATRLLHEPTWRTARELDASEASATIERFLPPGTPFHRAFERVRQRVPRRVR